MMPDSKIKANSTKPGSDKVLSSFWSLPVENLLQQLQTSTQGLTSQQAVRLLGTYGPNVLRAKRRSNALTIFLSQFKSPIILILIFAAVLSLFLHERTDAIIILVIILGSGLLGFWQEKGAADVVEKLLAIVQIKATAMRDEIPQEIPLEEVVPGDVVILSAGGVIPGDCLILESNDFFLDEAILTGETFPVKKSPGVLAAELPLSKRSNALFMGTHVVSGTARAVVVRTGKATELGKISEQLRLKQPETEFEHGIKHFGYFLMEVTLILVIAIFAFNVYLHRPVLDSFLFSLALAVGLTPQLLPAIISVNLAHGARNMGQKKVIVKRLVSIENFGSMNMFCSDKTGTLTEGVVRLHSALDIDSKESEKVLFYAYLNAAYETGFKNPIDEVIRAHRQFDLSGYQKLYEVPYDFVRKRLSILVAKNGRQHLMITKGAVKNVLEACSRAETPGGAVTDITSVRSTIQGRYEELSSQGFRTLAVAYREMSSDSEITKESETDMTFLGFLVFADPPKAGISDTIAKLNRLGISLKIITGDNRLIAQTVSKQVGLSEPQILTGPEIQRMSDEALLQRVNDIVVFAEVEPNQKERIIFALRKSGHVVGYMGDGINDASALHAADVSISVDSAADVAKEAADFVLLEKDLNVLVDGVQEGRKTFANTLKYVFMATSANFGNMFSMAGASLFLPFLPLLPKQILLMNFLTDLPEMTISTDSVDKELVDQPHRWNLRFIRNFMLVFGPLSSIFDYVTFGVLLLLLRASAIQFRTGWFMESVVSASLIVLVIRTSRPFYKSKPSNYLSLVTVLVFFATIIIPFTPLAMLFGFRPIPLFFLVVLVAIMVFYILGAEIAKRLFYQRVKF